MRFPNLVKLDLCNIEITDKTVEEVVDTCKLLEEIDFGGCSALTDASIVLLVTKCPCLRILLIPR